MMKYNWPIDLYPQREREEPFDLSPHKASLMAYQWPTVDELENIIAPMTADTVLQILRGQGIYWGWEIDHHVENDIPKVKGANHKKIENLRDPSKLISFPPENPYRLIPWKQIPKIYQKCIRIIMFNKRCTRRQAQEQFLPQVMSIKQVMK